MPLMGSLYVGNSGLQTSQNALHTTAHNLSNIDTVGYTRQQVVQATKGYNTVGQAYISSQQTGLGVSYAKVRQVREVFLDKTYRQEMGRSSYYDKSYTAATEIDTLFGEMEGVEFQTSLTDLWSAVQELKNDPANATNQGLLVSKAASFIDRAQAVYNGLSSYQDTLNAEIKDKVDTINDYGKKIWDLNQRIMKIENGHLEEANDLRDARNQLLDELSGYANITYDEDVFGAVTVSIEGVDFVTRTYINEMGTTQDAKTGFYTPVWPANANQDVFDLRKEISSDHNTDIGGLKALLVLRGDDRGRYTDIPDKDDISLYGDGSFTSYNDTVEDYNKTTNTSLIMNTMAEFDKLINGIVTSMNEVLNPELTDGAGNKYTAGINLFLRNNIDEQKTTNVAEAEDITLEPTLWTTSNIKVNPLLLQQYSYLGSTTYDGGATYTTGFMTEDMRENHDKSDALAQLFADDFSTLNPNVKTPATYIEYYKNLVGEVATAGNVYRNVAENQNATVEEIDASRQQVVGVSDNEELSNMIMFQNAYNASSRYINTINDMLATLIQSMGA